MFIYFDIYYLLCLFVLLCIIIVILPLTAIILIGLLYKFIPINIYSNILQNFNNNNKNIKMIEKTLDINNEIDYYIKKLRDYIHDLADPSIRENLNKKLIF